MRCDDVTRELAAPTGTVDAAALARHVASCRSCASWAEAGAQLDRLWNATRPADPTPSQWERIWSAVSAEIPAVEPVTLRLAPLASSPAIASPSRQRWLVPAIAAAFVAQAAMVSLATWALFRSSEYTPVSLATGVQQVQIQAPAPTTPAALAQASSQTIEFELEEGQTLFLVLDEQGGKVVCRPQFLATADLVAFDSESPDPYALAFQSDLEMLNAMESLE